jgi:hypothetical protein
MMHHLKLGSRISIAGLKMPFQYDTAVLALLAIPFGGIAAAWENPSLESSRKAAIAIKITGLYEETQHLTDSGSRCKQKPPNRLS